MDAKILKKTQDSLGKYIKKPPLTEKLLNKPPFRFLHDVATSVVKTTGFMKGLFSESEMSSENVKERDAKVAFLQKIVDMISLVLGKTLSVRPSKVVAGQEPEKTNELLQALAEAVGKKINNAEYVQRVLKGGDSKPSSASKKDSDRKKKDKEEDKKDDKKHRSREDRDKSRDRESSSKDRDREKTRDKDRHKESRDRDRDKDKSRDKDKERSRDKDKDKSRDKERSRDRREKSSKDRHGDDDKHKDRERRKDLPPRIPRPSSAKGSRRRRDAASDSSDEEEEHIRQHEREKSSRHREAVGEDDLPPQVANARKLQRPSSARPAPPRVKKNEGQEEPAMIGSSNVPNLITDKDDSDDDDNFITKEDDEPQPMMTAPPSTHDEDDEDGEHGGLVKKILEKKKELERGSQQPGRKTEIERSHVSDATRRKEREMIQKEIDKLRTSIQTLTRSVNPLGKILDFVQEDLDSMQKELIMWQKENKENSVALQREQSVTESYIEPLRAQLLELEAATSDQLDLIAAVKHNILKNDDKIEKMLSTVTKS